MTCEICPFSDKVFNGALKEVKEGRMELPEDDEDIFE